MNNTILKYTPEDLQDFYSTNKFPQNTQFQVMFTEGMNGKPYKTFHKTNSIREARKLLFDWLNKSHQSVPYSRVLFLKADTIVIDFGSHVRFGLIKITYPTN